jgi:hypothetical protein
MDVQLPLAHIDYQPFSKHASKKDFSWHGPDVSTNQGLHVQHAQRCQQSLQLIMPALSKGVVWLCLLGPLARSLVIGAGCARGAEDA